MNDPSYVFLKFLQAFGKKENSIISYWGELFYFFLKILQFLKSWFSLSAQKGFGDSQRGTVAQDMGIGDKCTLKQTEMIKKKKKIAT